jgi:hypothetical protein
VSFVCGQAQKADCHLNGFARDVQLIVDQPILDPSGPN